MRKILTISKDVLLALTPVIVALLAVGLTNLLYSLL